MNLGALDAGEVASRARVGELAFTIGDFDVCVRSSLPSVPRGVLALYDQYPLVESVALADFHIELNPPGFLRRYLRPQVQFSYDGYVPFKPLPQEQAYPMFEWGLNWCVANSAHDCLVIHAAVVERDGRAFIFPALPGSGKSTFCAALVSRGWRLLSDEMTLLDLRSGLVRPFPRPISLKNESITVIREFAEGVRMGDIVRDTSKGTVAHMRAPGASVQRAREPAPPAAVVFPQFRAGSATALSRVSRGEAFMEMASNSFNYHVLGLEGFEFLGDIVAGCEARRLVFSKLDEAIAALETLL